MPILAATLALVVLFVGTVAADPANAVVKNHSRKVDRRSVSRHHGRSHSESRNVSAISHRSHPTVTPTHPVEVGPSTAVSPSDAGTTPTPTTSPSTTSPTTTTTTSPVAPSAPPPPPATPAPPPPSTPGTTPSNTLLFSSDFARGLADWSLGGVGEATPRVVEGSEGPYCEFTLTGTQGRSELIMGDDLHITEGQTVLYEFEEFIVPGFAYGSRALGWNLFTQFKSDGEGSPMLALDLWNENGKKGLWVEPEPGPNYFVAPMEEGTWHRISMQITASASGQGGWVLYLDGQEVDRKTGMDTIRPGKTFAYIKNGLYRSGPTINANSRLRLRDVSLSMVS
jgi:hypothetical protein